MIYRLRGILVEKDTEGIVLDVGGVGYRASASLGTLRALPSLGEECVIHTRMVVREDAMLLFGFAAPEERAAFDALTAVSKVGPKLALAVLSAMSPPEISEAVARGDVPKLSSVPGLGRKTAERLVLELKGKDLAVFGAERAVSSDGGRTWRRGRRSRDSGTPSRRPRRRSTVSRPRIASRGTSRRRCDGLGAGVEQGRDGRLYRSRRGDKGRGTGRAPARP
jgi:Holliday junction DNA helicase RuvA